MAKKKRCLTSGKVCYPSEVEALRAISRLEFAVEYKLIVPRKSFADGKLVPYRCETCGEYHMTFKVEEGVVSEDSKTHDKEIVEFEKDAAAESGVTKRYGKDKRFDDWE